MSCLGLGLGFGFGFGFALGLGLANPNPNLTCGGRVAAHELRDRVRGGGVLGGMHHQHGRLRVHGLVGVQVRGTVRIGV